MKSITTIATSLGAFLAPLLFVLVVSAPAMATDRSGPTTPAPTPTSTESNSKNTVNLNAVIFGAITVGTTAVCVYKRWWENDPCIGEAKPVKTSAADDKITPDNASDKKDEGEIYIFKGR